MELEDSGSDPQDQGKYSPSELPSQSMKPTRAIRVLSGIDCGLQYDAMPFEEKVACLVELKLSNERLMQRPVGIRNPRVFVPQFDLEIFNILQ
jgi:hypothetical protein